MTSIVFSGGQYLSRALGTPTDARKGRLEFSCKRTSTNIDGVCVLGTTSAAFLGFGGVTMGGTKGSLIVNYSGSPKFVSNEIPAAGIWHSIVIWWDTTAPAPTDRFGASIDGVTCTWQTAVWPAIGATLGILDAAVAHEIGALPGYSVIDFIGNLAHVRFQDGNPLAGGALGNNGFELDFVDSIHLGTDNIGVNNWGVVGAPTWSAEGDPPPPPPPIDSRPNSYTLFWGQSNAAFVGESGYVPRYPSQVTISDLSSGGGGGSVVVPFGDERANSNIWKHNYVCTVAVGGSAIQTWANGGSNHPLIQSGIDYLKSVGAKFVEVIRLNGETDSTLTTTPAQFNAWNEDVKNACRANTDLEFLFIEPRESFDINAPQPTDGNRLNVLAGQALGVNYTDSIPGPSMDLLVDSDPTVNNGSLLYRWPGDHLKILGQEVFAYALAVPIIAYWVGRIAIKNKIMNS